MEKTVYTHDEAAALVEMFEDTLLMMNDPNNKPDDEDERGDDNEGLYGSVYSNLLDSVEAYLIGLLKRANGAEIITDVFSGDF